MHIKENLAFHKPAYQHHPYQGDFLDSANARNAVDGKTLNLNVSEEDCVLSDERQENATLWVNLTRICSIHHITIYYMTGTKKWGMSFIHILDLCLSTRFTKNLKLKRIELCCKHI